MFTRSNESRCDSFIGSLFFPFVDDIVKIKVDKKVTIAAAGERCKIFIVFFLQLAITWEKFGWENPKNS